MGLLFDAVPPGFRYIPDFLSPEEEVALVSEIQAMEFSDVRMRGVIARRRVRQFGSRYSFDTWKLSEGPELPEFLRPLRARAAALIDVTDSDLSETLVTEYREAATIGWHRDAPLFGTVVGISLLSTCMFKLRRGGETRTQKPLSIEMAPRSGDVLDGEARRDWQHSIPAVKSRRYSITFRTLRKTSTRVPPTAAGV